MCFTLNVTLRFVYFIKILKKKRKEKSMSYAHILFMRNYLLNVKMKTQSNLYVRNKKRKLCDILHFYEQKYHILE